MNTIRNFIKKQAVVTYFILTFVITWGAMLLMAGPQGFPLSEEQLSALGPMIYVGMLVGPSFSALLLTALESGKAGFGKLWAQLSKWRISIRWYALALLATPLLATLILLVLSPLSTEFQPAIFTVEDKISFIIMNFVMGLFIGLFEELGWLGFVVPRMRQRTGLLATGIIVGLLWGAWHFPPFWEGNSFSAFFPLLLLVIRLFAWLPAYRVLMVWFYDRTGSLFVSILMHASLDFTMLSLPSATLSGNNLVIWILVWSAALWLFVGAIALRRKVQPVPQTIQRQAF